MFAAAFLEGERVMIDLRSDTVTLPTEEMLEAMRYARVGDDILREDLSVKELEKLAAEIMGKEAALFTVSGTMSNQIAVMTLTERGEEIIVGDKSHIFNLEVGGVAALSQVQVHPVDFRDGKFGNQELEKYIRPYGVQSPRSSLLCLENTYDLNRGIAISKEQIEIVSAFAHENNMNVYMDGARIFNAAQKLQIEVSQLCKPVDAVQFCLTKGLCAPFGAVLAGSNEFVEKARWFKQRLGGGFRQAGYMAAVASVALQKATEQVEEDNRKAEHLASLLLEKHHDLLEWLPNQTNIIKIDISVFSCDEKRFLQQLERDGILIKPLGSGAFRLVCHKDIQWSDLKKISEKICCNL